MKEQSLFSNEFFYGSPTDRDSLGKLCADLSQLIDRNLTTKDEVYSGRTPSELDSLVAHRLQFSQPEPWDQILKNTITPLLEHSINPSHPLTLAHLHCPPLKVAVAAELVIASLNQSMDSWDQAPLATTIEKKMIRWALELVGFDPASGDGVFTSGGSQSNLMGLMLARDHFVKDDLGQSLCRNEGISGHFAQAKILCSEISHFTVEKSAFILGLGEACVVHVPVTDEKTMNLAELKGRLIKMRQNGEKPLALVATAGSTDFGSYDPLIQIAALAKEYGCWFHIDAAVGAGALMSAKLKPLMEACSEADSITLDFHKLLYQPISCSAFLVKDSARFSVWERHSDYLDRSEDRLEGIDNLANKSLQTTRRFDALKLYLSLQYYGESFFAGAIDHCCNLASELYENLVSAEDFETSHSPQSNSLVFRWAPEALRLNTDVLNHLQKKIRNELLRRGVSLIGQTAIGDKTYLKLTLLNPLTQQEHLMQLVHNIRQQGQRTLKELQ